MRSAGSLGRQVPGPRGTCLRGLEPENICPSFIPGKRLPLAAMDGALVSTRGNVSPMREAGAGRHAPRQNALVPAAPVCPPLPPNPHAAERQAAARLRLAPPGTRRWVWARPGSCPVPHPRPACPVQAETSLRLCIPETPARAPLPLRVPRRPPGGGGGSARPPSSLQSAGRQPPEVRARRPSSHQTLNTRPVCGGRFTPAAGQLLGPRSPTPTAPPRRTFPRRAQCLHVNVS